MKIRYIVIIGLIFIIAFLVLTISISSRKTRITDMKDLTFEELCNKNGDMWMEMESWREGKKISDEKCFGCMIGDNHFCTAQEYIDNIKEIQASKMRDNYMASHNAMTAHARKNDYVEVHKYSVQFMSRDMKTESDAGLTFTIKNIESGEPVSNLEIVHDKIMHVVLVRKDMVYFDHIHPLQKEIGTFFVPYSFYASGDYRIWIDFTIEGMQHIVDFDTSVSGTSEATQEDRLKNLNVKIKTLDKIKIGEPTRLEFIVTDYDNNPVLIKEKFLAANAHIIIIDKSLDEFGHTHDEKFDEDNILSFEYIFQKNGMHKLWVQFSVDGITRTGEFEIMVNE